MQTGRNLATLYGEIRGSVELIAEFKEKWSKDVPQNKSVPAVPRELAKVFNLGERFQKEFFITVNIEMLTKDHKDVITAIDDDLDEIIQNVQAYYAKRWNFLSRHTAIFKELDVLTDKVSKFFDIFMTSISIGSPPQGNPDDILTDHKACTFWKTCIPT